MAISSITILRFLKNCKNWKKMWEKEPHILKREACEV